MDGNATDAGIAVNAAGDVLVSYSEVPWNSTTFGYLGAAYTFESHSDCQEAFLPQKYEHGLGVFPPDIFGMPPARTGDYTAAAVDPLDDNGFITAAACAGSLSGSYYYWSEAVAMVQPAAPNPPTFIAHDNEETECLPSQQTCSVTVTAPASAIATDTFFVVVAAGLEPSSMTPPSG